MHIIRYVPLKVSMVVLVVGCVSLQAQKAIEPSSDFSPPAEQRQLSLSDIRTHCIKFTGVSQGDNPEDYRDCAVTESGDLREVDGRIYSYAIYCLIPAYNNDGAECGDGSFHATYFQNRAVAIFVRDRSIATSRVLLDRVSPDFGLNYYEPPEIVVTPMGITLFVPIAVDGTGHGNASEYYLRDGQRWRPIDADGWLHELKTYVPASLETRTGIWPDLRTMTAVAGLYRAGDANCCPTAGTLQIRLMLRSGRFVIESAEVRPP